MGGGGLREGRLGGGGGSRRGDLGCWGGGKGGHRLPLPPLALPTMLIGLNKIPRISFMAAFATSCLSILDPNTHSDPSLG